MTLSNDEISKLVFDDLGVPENALMGYSQTDRRVLNIMTSVEVNNEKLMEKHIIREGELVTTKPT